MKALVVGLDAFTPQLTFPWARDGVLPTLGKLMNEGVWGRLQSVPNMNSAPAWSSFATGLGPGKHGIFYFTEVAPGTYCTRNLNASHRHGAAFWKRLSDLGYTTGVVNLPMTYPAEPINGFMVAGMDAPATHSQGFSYPPGLFEQIVSRLEYPYCIEAEVHRAAGRARWDEAARVITECLEARREFVLRALDEFPSLDVLTIVFTAADVAQHFFWRFLEPDAFGVEKSGSEKTANLIQRVYRRLDAVLGELIERAAPQTVIVVSDHGAGFNQRGGDLLFEWLQNVGLLRTRGESVPVQRWLDRLRDWVGLGNRQCPQGTRSIPKLGCVDWSRTRAYCVGTDDIYINLRGREPRGLVAPSQYDNVCREIIERLLETVDPETRDPVIEVAATREEVYEGSLVHRAPDVMIRWKTEHVLKGLDTPGSPPVRAEGVPLITGGHRPYGVFLAAGTGIQEGLEVREASITDIAPTLLYLLGDAVPASMDGRVLTESFKSGWMALHPVITEERPREKTDEPLDVPDEDAELVEERLRGLGYID